MVKLILAFILFFQFGANAALVNSVTVNNPQIPVSQSGIWAIDVTDNFLTDAQLRASPLAVNVQNFPTTQNVNVVGGTVAVSGDITVANNFLTDAQLRASAVPVSLSSVPTHAVTQSGSWTVGVDNFPTSFTANIGTTNGLALDTSVNSLLKPASTLNAVTTVGSITNAVTIKADIPANQTNALKVDGSAVTQPISGSVSVSNFPASQPVTGSFLTDTQLRATAVPVSLASVPTHAVTQSGTWNVGLNAGTNAIGSITNTAFGISGTLPAFATTPTFNVGTIGGIATETTLSALNSKSPNLGQALMAASVPVTIASNQSSIPVTATISGTPSVTVSNASLAVTGPLTDTQLRASAVPVSLASTTISNFPATQAISAATLPLPTGAAQDRTTAAAPNSTRLSDGTAFYDARQIRALTSSDVVTVANPQTSVSITGTPNVNVSNASLPVTQSGAWSVDAKSVNQQTITSNLTAAGQTASITLQGEPSVAFQLSGTWTATVVFEASVDGANFTTINAQRAGDNTIVQTVVNSTGNDVYRFSTAGFAFIRARVSAFTSGTVAITAKTSSSGSTQVLTAPPPTPTRVMKIYSATFTGAVAEGLVTLTPITDGTAGTAATSHVVTSGKRLKIQAINLTVRNAGAAGQGSVVNLRMNTAGAVTTTSPLIATCAAGTYLAVANIAGSQACSINEGIEIAGNGTIQIGLSQIGTATANNTVTVIAYEY